MGPVSLVLHAANKGMLHVSAEARTEASRAKTVAVGMARNVEIHVGIHVGVAINSSSSNSILLLQKTEFGQQQNLVI